MANEEEDGDYLGDPIRIEAVIGENVKSRRENRGLSQAEFGKLLATYLGTPWPPQTVSAAEKGRRQFIAAEVASIARLLNCRPQDLFTPEQPRRVQLSDVYTTDPDFSAPLERSLDDSPLDLSSWLQPFSDAYRELLHAKGRAAELKKLSEQMSKQLDRTERKLIGFLPEDQPMTLKEWDALDALENMEEDPNA